VRRSVAALRAEPLAEKPLPESISGLFTASEANGLMTAFHCQGAERTLPPAVAWTLYRTAQEALTNVRKHARASQVEALLTYNVSSVQLEIRDNGIGFSGDGSGDGKFGLLGLRERADLLHGRFSVVSSPQTGTTVTMELPLA
jgi:signal transduction histidine kinase